MCVHITSDLLLLSRFLSFANSRLTKGVTFCHHNALNHVIQLLDLEPSVGFDIRVIPLPPTIDITRLPYFNFTKYDMMHIHQQRLSLI